MAALGFLFLLSGPLASRFSGADVFGQVSGVFIVAMAAPSYMALTKWMGARRGALTLCVLCTLPVLVEAAAILTGFPYGAFSYSGKLGYMVLGLVPWSVSFAYPPILLGSMTVAGRYRQDRFGFAALTAAANVLVDLVVDPGAVHSGLWFWLTPGPYFGVPTVNFLGWFVTSVAYASVFHALSRGRVSIDAGASSSLVLILCFWSGYLLVNGLYAPAILGVLEVTALIGTYRI